MTPSQEDCIERHGQCQGCCNGLESMDGTCMVRWSRPVARTLGLDRKYAPPGLGSSEVNDGVRTLPCLRCGEEIEVKFNATHILCPDCRKVRKNEQMREKRREAAEERAANIQICGLPECDRAFSPKTKTQRYCCRSCQTRANKRQIAEANRIRSQERSQRRKSA